LVGKVRIKNHRDTVLLSRRANVLLYGTGRDNFPDQTEPYPSSNTTTGHKHDRSAYKSAGFVCTAYTSAIVIILRQSIPLPKPSQIDSPSLLLLLNGRNKDYKYIKGTVR
jgi:hypothetical protein